MTRQNTGVEIIGVPNPDDGDDDDRLAFVARMSSPIPHVLDDPGELWRSHGVVSQPTMIVVAADGTTTTYIGRAEPQRLLERVERLAATSPG